MQDFDGDEFPFALVPRPELPLQTLCSKHFAEKPSLHTTWYGLLFYGDLRITAAVVAAKSTLTRAAA